MTHTPGPWLLEADEVTANDGDVIVADLGLFNSCVADEWQGNGRLIAAAPNLLAALKLIVQTHDMTCKGEDCGISGIDLAKAAIAKAEGR